MTYNNGDIYICNWIRDSRVGHCIEIKANGDRFEGNIENEMYFGKCKMTYTNGDKFEGEYIGEKNGKGMEV